MSIVKKGVALIIYERSWVMTNIQCNELADQTHIQYNWKISI